MYVFAKVFKTIYKSFELNEIHKRAFVFPEVKKIANVQAVPIRTSNKIYNRVAKAEVNDISEFDVF